MKYLKTPLRYPGGKSRAVPKLFKYFPDMSNVKEYREPFLGGGSVAIAITKQYPDINIWVNDLYEPLYNFWVELRDNGEYLHNQLAQLKTRYPDRGSAKGLFLDAKEAVTDENQKDKDRAVAFYIVNKCSFSGLTESSSFSPQASDSNFSMRGINFLPEYSRLITNWKITNLSYEQLLCDDKQTFIYLDPPYDIRSNLYGKRGNMHKGFDHDVFASDCDRFISPQLVSYNSSQLVCERFKGWEAGQFDHTYTMRSVGTYMNDQQERKELVLLNYGT
jgi:DNA adenine methylase|tara:strand:- start:1948 stop:2775 length:828 start_codon:yes stop_codon:yes gene_type:complete